MNWKRAVFDSALSKFLIESGKAGFFLTSVDQSENDAVVSASAIGPSPMALASTRGSGRARSVALSLVVPGLFVLFWQISTTVGHSRLIPPPTTVAVMMYDFAFGGVWDDAFSHTLLINLVMSASRVYGGFLIAAAIGIPLGLLIGRIKLAAALLDPMLQLMRPIPVTAWLPLFMIIFGLGGTSAFALVALGCFFPVLLNTIFGVRSVDPKLFEAGAMLGCRGSRVFRRIVLPAALPSIFTGLRLSLGIAWVVIVVGEMTGVPEGLGAVIMDARQLSRTDLVICGMIVIGIAGFLSDRAIIWIGERLLDWSPQVNR
jgi:NitT/TauT family transport system permease protein